MRNFAAFQRVPRFALLLVFVAATAAAAKIQQSAVEQGAGQLTLSIDPARCAIHWTLGSTLHTVHGTFRMKRGEVHFDPATGNAGGELVADATSGKSDNDSRDRKMHKEILESAKYTDVVFRPTKIDGSVAIPGSSSVQIHGVFVLHGAENEITVPVEAEMNGTQWKASARFTVPYVEWGLKSPNTFLLKADPAVEIELELHGSVQKGSAP